jgi:hypothetical protein
MSDDAYKNATTFNETAAVTVTKLVTLWRIVWSPFLQYSGINQTSKAGLLHLTQCMKQEQ